MLHHTCPVNIWLQPSYCSRTWNGQSHKPPLKNQLCTQRILFLLTSGPLPTQKQLYILSPAKGNTFRKLKLPVFNLPHNFFLWGVMKIAACLSPYVGSRLWHTPRTTKWDHSTVIDFHLNFKKQLLYHFRFSCDLLHAVLVSQNTVFGLNRVLKAWLKTVRTEIWAEKLHFNVLKWNTHHLDCGGIISKDYKLAFYIFPPAFCWYGRWLFKNTGWLFMISVVFFVFSQGNIEYNLKKTIMLVNLFAK